MKLSFAIQGKHRSKMIEFGISRLLVFLGEKAGQPMNRLTGQNIYCRAVKRSGVNEAIASLPGAVHGIEADLGTSAGAMKLIEEAHCVIIFS
jgi:hypothetical protein